MALKFKFTGHGPNSQITIDALSTLMYALYRVSICMIVAIAVAVALHYIGITVTKVAVIAAGFGMFYAYTTIREIVNQITFTRSIEKYISEQQQYIPDPSKGGWTSYPVDPPIKKEEIKLLKADKKAPTKWSPILPGEE